MPMRLMVPVRTAPSSRTTVRESLATQSLRPIAWLTFSISTLLLPSMPAGRCYGMQKVMAKGGLTQADKMELLPFMDALEKV